MKTAGLKKYLPAFSWALYDFANTIFSMNVMSLYFALWLIEDHGGKDIHYSLVYTCSMIAVILIAPMTGRLADLRSRRREFLILSTGLCIASTAMIGILNSLVWGLVFIFTANIGYQLALVFYDGLLPSVAEPPQYGRVSGIGVALGYGGSIAGITMVAAFVYEGPELLRYRAFVPTAVLFLLFSLPCFLWVKENRQVPQNADGGFSWKQIVENVRRYPGVPAYLVTMFLAQNAVNTVILFMGVYSSAAGGMDQTAINRFFVIATVAALLSALVFGKATDRLGPRKMGLLALWIWVAGLLTAAVSFGPAGFWTAGCLIGTGLGGLWTASRPLLLMLVPREESATFFSFNVLTGRFAAILGPLVWGLVVWAGEPLGPLRYRLAVGAMLVFMLAGLYAFRFIPEPAPETPENALS